MNQIHVLDCTLRDGGYCNNWEFGYENKRKILKGLIEADLDVIECGFLTNKIVYDQNGTKFTNLSEISEILPTDRKGKIFVAMVNFGEYDLEKLPCYDGTSIDGIRVAFHKKDREKALEWCRIIGDKGYKVYRSFSGSISEFVASINIYYSKKINKVHGENIKYRQYFIKYHFIPLFFYSN